MRKPGHPTLDERDSFVAEVAGSKAKAAYEKGTEVATEVTEFAKIAPFKIIEAKNGDAWIKVQDRRMSPPEISSSSAMTRSSKATMAADSRPQSPRA